jgi:hypothetical protein
MSIRSIVLTTALAALIAPAQASPALRRFDLVTYAVPDGFTVQEAGDHVAITRVGTKSYCLIAIFAGADAARDLDASFAAAWTSIALRAAAPVAVPATQSAQIGGAGARVGAAMTTTQGQPVLVMLTTIDAGARTVSVVVMTPGPDDLKIYTPSIQAVLNSMTIARVDAAPAAPAAAPPTGGVVALGGKLTVAFAPRSLTLADLAGDWKNDDGSLTRYVSASTGAYAGFDSIQSTAQWSIDARKGTVLSNFHGVQTGNHGTFAVDEKRLKKITLTDGDLYLVPKPGEGAPQHFFLGGWQVYPQFTVMVLIGPYYNEGIPDRVRQDANNGFTNVWIRKNGTPP